jgi:hypothetical protein
MTIPRNIRDRWLSAYEELEARGEALKDSQSVAFGLLELYDSLAECDQRDLLPILAGWLLSDDSRHRYDATFIAMERHVTGLVPAIAEAIARLEQIPGPEASDEVEGLVELRKTLLNQRDRD